MLGNWSSETKQQRRTTIYSTPADMQHIEELESPGRFPAYSSLQVVGIVCKSNSQTTMSYMPLFNKVMKMLALDKTIAMVPLQRQDLKNRSGKDKNAGVACKEN